MLIDPSTIEYKYFNDRDFEMPLLLNLVAEKKPRLLLDVGAHFSWYTYAPFIRERLQEGGIYDAIDIMDCPQTAEIVDTFTKGSVLDMGNVSYDFVSCISVVEHCGITSYKKDDVIAEQDAVVQKMVEIAHSDLLITCPFGAPGLWEGQYQNITGDQRDRWVALAENKGFSVECQYLYSQFPQGGKPWETVTARWAEKVPIDTSKGVQCNMIFYATR
jgi:hypothetical protein